MTDHVKNQLCARIEELEAEKLELNEQIDALLEERDALAEKLEAAERERNFLIEEYERAVGCGAQGFAHAAFHLFNAITNAKADINTENFLALRGERDALAAHVERLKPIAHYGLRAARNRNCPDSLEWTNILADAPETRLARLKAQWQAEALDKLAVEGNWASEAIRWEADELRRQAEGGEE